MQRILITGGAGFIGSNFIRLLLEERPNYHIINLDKLTYAGNLSTLEDISTHPKYQFIQGDIADPVLVDEIFKTKIDAVVNFAAESHVDRSIENPDAFVQSNIVGVHNLLNKARIYNTERFLQISTDEVYGQLGKEGYFTEDTPIQPSSPYSSSKASGDLLVQAWHHTYGMHTNITRCSNNYGPYQYPEKLIPVIIARATEDKNIPVYGDGSNIRDWIHVFDHNRAALAVLEKGVSGRVYNIGASCERDNITLVKLLLDILGKPHSLIEFVTDRAGHDWRYAIDSSRIQSELSWVPRYSFDDGIEQTVEWYLNNTNWWKALLEQS